MEPKQAKFTIRVNSELLKKFHFVAEYNARSANREIEVIMREHVKAFERIYGRIEQD